MALLNAFKITCLILFKYKMVSEKRSVNVLMRTTWTLHGKQMNYPELKRLKFKRAASEKVTIHQHTKKQKPQGSGENKV